MPRTMRKRSRTGLYHVMAKGNAGQDIFNHDRDRRKFLEVLSEVKSNSEATIKIYAYCLMGNHFHLLLQDESDTMGDFMRIVMAQYALWRNKRYEISGHVFQDRYKSEPVEDDRYFFTVFRYILQNPVKAGIAESPFSYPWNSWDAYAGKMEKVDGLTDTEYILSFLERKKQPKKEGISLERLKQFIGKANHDTCLDVDYIPWALTDEQLLELIHRNHPDIDCRTLHELPKTERDQHLHTLKGLEQVKTAQLARITGLGEHVIRRAKM